MEIGEGEKIWKATNSNVFSNTIILQRHSHPPLTAENKS